MPRPESVGPHPEKSYRRNRNLLAMSCAILATAGVGSFLANSTPWYSDKVSSSPSAKDIERDLNSPAHVANGVTVEMGYELPLKPQTPIKGAVAVTNPIKLGKDTYGYVAPIPAAGKQAGKVAIKTVHYTGRLKPTTEGGHSLEYAHEVTTPLAKVHESYHNSATGQQENYYSVVMGNQPGSIDNLIYIPPYLPQKEQNLVRAQQEGEIAANRAGDLLYSGK